MIKRIIGLVSVIVCTVSSMVMATEHRYDSGLIGPFHNHGKTEVKKENPALKVIEEKYANVLKTDVTKEELDSFFTASCDVSGYVAEIFDMFKDTNGETAVVQKAQEILP